MEEIEILKLEDIQYEDKYFKDIQKIKTYFEIRNQMKQFSFKVHLKSFIILFGEKEGTRLWGHFLKDCKTNLEKFETYLTTEQMTLFIVNGLLNPKILNY